MREFAKLVVLQMLRVYKWAISPLLPPACRFVPTCSEYAAEAVERHGVVRGGSKALIRLLRCHPFSRGGYDPVVTGDSAENENPRYSPRTRQMGRPTPSLANQQPPTTPAPGAIFPAVSRTL
jgi:putative membrane protein insertion efficiency factor